MSKLLWGFLVYCISSQKKPRIRLRITGLMEEAAKTLRQLIKLDEGNSG